MIYKNLHILILLFALVFPATLMAQEEGDLKHDLSSPYNTLSTHLKNLSEGHYDPKAASEVFDTPYPKGGRRSVH